MKVKKAISPYSKMYMVGPAVYAKLLNCLDAVDKKITENLNRTDVEEEAVLRPSERQLQIIQQNELNNDADQQQQQEQQQEAEPDNDTDQQQQQEEEQLQEQEEEVGEIQQQEQGDENETQNEQNNNDDETQFEKIEPTPNILRSPCPDKTTDMRGDKPQRIIPCGNKKSAVIVPSIRKRYKEKKCPICSKKFTVGWNLRTHIATAHKKIPAQDDRLSCSLCDKKFEDFNMLDYHMKMIHPNYTSEEDKLKLSEADLDKLSPDVVMRKTAKKIQRSPDEFMQWAPNRLPRKVKRKVSYTTKPGQGKVKLTTQDPFENPSKKQDFHDWA